MGSVKIETTLGTITCNVDNGNLLLTQLAEAFKKYVDTFGEHKALQELEKASS